MGAPDDFLYEYAIVRYVPRIDRHEFVNIGLIMMCKRRKWMKGRLLFDRGRLTAFDPRVDIERLRAQASVFERDDAPASDLPTEEKYRWLAAVKSAVLQVSPSHPGMLCGVEEVSAEEGRALLQKEFDRLFDELVAV